jgi:hypothetical protein
LRISGRPAASTAYDVLLVAEASPEDGLEVTPEEGVETSASTKATGTIAIQVR